VEAGLADLCSLIEERSQAVLPRLLGEGFLAGAAFVEGSHIFNNTSVWLTLKESQLVSLVDGPSSRVILRKSL
jgi:hypothetical protein